MRRRTPRLWFVDFWHRESTEALESENWLYRALSEHRDLRLDPADPEFLLCSVFDHKHYRYSRTKATFLGDNVFPDFRFHD